ncbi:FmdE family protein [Pseudodesulfovibrio sp.]|uniref:FmdE family protein n=1 Tax=unclassified Pseudodesulfovibrio TaxID=2661612 RepID=UPI003B00D9F1
MPCTIPEDIINSTIAYHGHICPGLSIGIRAAELGMREVGDPATIQMVAVSETDMCGVDAIQFITGCTLGKGNFIHRDYGKMAFSFFNRETGKGIRAVLTPNRSTLFREFRELTSKEAKGQLDEQGKQTVQELRPRLQKEIMQLELEDLFDVAPLETGLPRPPQVLESLVCTNCGEATMESRTRRMGGKTYCIPCFEKIDQKL